MKYTKQALQYFFKNILYVLPLVIFPAFLFAISMDMDALDIIAKAFLGGQPQNLSFVVVFHAVSVFNFHSLGAFFSCVGVFVLMAICGSILMALMEKHMRIGKRTFNGVLSKINDNLISTIGICVLFALLYQVWALIISAIISLITQLNSLALIYILSAILFLGSQFVLTLVLSVFYLWLPCLQITGFRAFEALRYSNQLVSPEVGKLAFGQFISLTFAEVVFLLVAYFATTGAVVLVATVVYAFMIAIFCIRMQITYFDLAQMDRMDLKKYYTP